MISKRRVIQLAAVVAAALITAGLPSAAIAQGEFIVVQSTTSTQNSGLLDDLLPKFTARTGIEVRVVAVGTGQAIKNARNGDGDVLLVHARAAEERFVEEGFAAKRHDLMYNDFVIVGPASDPAGIGGTRDPIAALQKIAAARAPFASRGDESGTHRKEMRLWAQSGVNPVAASGTWYRETGSGMGATLNTAVGMSAYTITDRATWIAFRNKRDFRIHVEDDEMLFNQYGVIVVNPRNRPNPKARLGQTFVDWLLSSEGQSAIAAFKVDGQQLFFPNARPGS